jgi:hypothetical protein
MNRNNNGGHIDEMVTDYVLDLLSIEERLIIHSHVAECPRCQHVVESHRQIGVAIKQTIANSSLNELIENNTSSYAYKIPQKRLATLLQIQRQIVLAGIALVLLVASIGFQMNFHLNKGFATVPVAQSANGGFNVTVESTPASTFVSDVIPGQAVPTPPAAISEEAPRVVLVPAASEPVLLTVTP